MFYRLLIAMVAMVVVLAAGCSSDKPASPASTSPASKTSASASKSSEQSSSEKTSTSKAAGTLDDDACLKVAEANIELTTADKKDDARKAADVLLKYNPPDNVKTAIEQLVEKAEASNDPDADKNGDLVDGWVEKVCPL